MLTQNDVNLDFFKPKYVERRNNKRRPHFLKKYFKSRRVSQVKLAQYLGISQGNLNTQLNYPDMMDPAIEVKLVNLKTKIDLWEIENNKLFGFIE